MWSVSQWRQQRDRQGYIGTCCRKQDSAPLLSLPPSPVPRRGEGPQSFGTWLSSLKGTLKNSFIVMPA